MAATTEALHMHAEDNVALAAVELEAGRSVRLDGQEVTLTQKIPFGHKFALDDIDRGEFVLKYGQPIGRATAQIRRGQHVHVHNVESLRGRGDLGAGGAGRQRSQAPLTLKPSAAGDDVVLPEYFMGYRRADGRAGVRNHVLVLATVQCANAVVERVGQAIPEAVAISHAYGCSQIGADADQTQRVLTEFASHPNVGAVLLVGLGCESVPTLEIAETVRGRGMFSEHLIIQDEGGNRPTYARALAIVREMLQETTPRSREPIPLAELVLGTECGGSDSWSGVTGNPATGVAADLLVRAGGTVILSEVPEFIGAEHLVAARAVSPEVAAQVTESVLRAEQGAMRMGVDMRGSQPTPGNIAGGLTTIEEKSLGAVAKGGTTPVQEYVGYGCRAGRRGLVVMDTPGNDAESVTGMVAGGAQVVVFTTGRGSPTGCPIAPVIKVATNSAMYRRLHEDMDIDAGTIVEQQEPLSAIGRRIFDEVLFVAAGKRTAAEEWGHKEFAINIIGPRL